MKISKPKYNKLIVDIGIAITEARNKAIAVVNRELVKANWEIGRHIVEFEQSGNERAEYGSDLLARLSKDLTLKYGRGFGRRNVLDMRRFYITYQKWQAVPAKLSWSHIVVLLPMQSNAERKFYEKQTAVEHWGYRELERQIDASLFERLSLSRDKRGVLALSKKGHVVTNAADISKEPYILDFIKVSPSHRITEKQLEQILIDNLQAFLLELGKGFAFVARQYRIPISSKPHYVDLLFYHRILKCFVIIDLKIGNVKHDDIGQMNTYLNYFKAEENTQGDNEPIGIILSKGKNEVLVEYALGGMTNKIFVSKYQLYLPDKKQLQKQISALI
ncbi:PDDEXK nuclease domain-containing protein [soil metagenome]